MFTLHSVAGYTYHIPRNTLLSPLTLQGEVYDFHPAGPVSPNEDCVPSPWAINGYYLPGVCPDGYTAACSRTRDETRMTICCPTFEEFACESTLADSVFGCHSGYDTSLNVIELTDPEFVETYYDARATLRAFSIAVGGNVATTAATATTTSSSSSSSSAMDTEASSAPRLLPDERSLSRGAIGGIVVGVIAAVALGAAGAFLLSRRRPSLSRPPPSPTPDLLMRRSSSGRQSKVVRYELEAEPWPAAEVPHRRRSREQEQPMCELSA
ncbi:hypothetical protein GGS23DRAFT_82071 [Durotheca rogersii]|uniref:uncharacterized protein n=1 Tax=Durotheca rogersii TaxID=419775 RepID=UPI00221F9598|nr:uncharacterized protein GGS23DRAFT_82071 [Durotheca rogersii]KAI5862565.1 hypothetical protein GGS23DRAFT_82071 [Durotheca rogersii]